MSKENITKKDELIEKLSNLDEDSINRLLGVLESQTKVVNQKVVVHKKRKQTRKNKKKSQNGVDTTGSKVILSSEDTQPRQRRSSRRSSSNKHNRNGRPSGVPSVPQPMFIGERPNKFLEMGMDKKYKGDTRLQKKLSGDNDITERRQEIQLVSALCTECEYIFEDVHPSLVTKDDDGLYFMCDDCQLSRKRE